MKKIIALLAAVGTAGMLSAQVTFGIGARGTFGFGLGSTLDEDMQLSSHTEYTTQPFKSFLAGGALVGRIGFASVPGLFIQPEIGFSHNQLSYKAEYSDTDTETYLGHTIKVVTEYDYEGSIGYNSIDIPIIIGYDVEVGKGLVISPFGGFNLSIPVGSFSSSETKPSGTVIGYLDGQEYARERYVDDDDGGSSSMDVKTSITPGVLFGVGVGYKFDDHNMIMGDLRYLLDFTPVKGDVNFFGAHLDWDIFTRRGLSIGVNYVYFF